MRTLPIGEGSEWRIAEIVDQISEKITLSEYQEEALVCFILYSVVSVCDDNVTAKEIEKTLGDISDIIV